MIERRYEGNQQAKVYFKVHIDACESCDSAFLKNGKGSEPKLFTLKQLQANGSNIGRKKQDWLPTIQAYHVNCRCLLTEYIEGQVWNGHKFIWPENQPYKPSLNRAKIRIVFQGKEHFV